MTTDVQSADADFNSVFSRDSGADSAAPSTVPRDEQGRFAPKSEPDVKAEPPPIEALKPEVQQEQTEQANQSRHVPLHEVLSEREKRKDEAKRREEAEKRASEYEGRLKAYERMMEMQQRQQPAQRQPDPEPEPDPYTQPEEYARRQSERQMVAVRNQIANMSEAIARRSYGAELVEKATTWALQTGNAQRFYMHSADPYGELVETYKKVSAFQEIGDPTKYREKLEAEIRQKVLDELKAGGNQPKPSFPGTLADATPAGANGAHLSIEAVANDVFSSSRNRRA